MKAPTLKFTRRAFLIAAIALTTAFLGFMAYLFATYGRMLGGEIVSGSGAELLTHFNSERFERAIQRLERRMTLPDPDPDLPNPFGIPPAR